MSIEGLITVRSSFGHGETLGRCEAAIRAHGMSVVARVDHAGGALEMSGSADATRLLVFRNCAHQAALVKALRLISLELPFKVLIWEDATAQTCLSYTDFRWLAKRYGVPHDKVYLFTDIAVRIDGIVRKAASRP